jgi:hypothetical protein
VNKLSEEVYQMWTDSRMQAPLNVEPTEWFIHVLLARVDQVLLDSYRGPLPHCEEAIDQARIQIKEWAYRG